MRKTVICNITMKEKTDKCKYRTTDLSLPVSAREVVYPVSAFLEKTLTKDDEIKAVMLVKKDPNGNYQKNAAEFVEEILAINESIGAKIDFKTVETSFSEEQTVHEELLGKIVDEIDNHWRFWNAFIIFHNFIPSIHCA